jgi:hypothetical protein
MRVTILVAIVASVMLTGATSAAQNTADEEARVAFQAGVDHYNAERIEEALVEFRRAYDLKPSWKIMFNIGQCEAALGRYGLALDMFERYIVEGGDEVPNQRRDYVSAEVRRIQPMVGSLQVVAPDGTTVLVDSMERATTPLKGPLRVASGSHEVILKSGDEELLKDTFSVAGGMTTEVAVPGAGTDPGAGGVTLVDTGGAKAPPPPADVPPPEPRRKKGLLIAGVAVFGGGYIFSALVGYLAYTEATVPEGQTCINCKETGSRMFIPLVGPFLAIEYADGTDGRVVSALMGGVQVIGVALTVLGAIVYVKSGKPAETASLGREQHALSRLRLGATAERGGGTLSLGVTF